MSFTIIISDKPFGDSTPQEDIERRRAERMARKTAKEKAKDKAKTNKSRRCIEKAKKVKLAGGKFNTQEGLIHYKRKRDDGEGDRGGGPSWSPPCMNAQFAGPE